MLTALLVPGEAGADAYVRPLPQLCETGAARMCQASATNMRGRRCSSSCWGLLLRAFTRAFAALHASDTKNTLRASSATCTDALILDCGRCTCGADTPLLRQAAQAACDTAQWHCCLAAAGRLHANGWSGLRLVNLPPQSVMSMRRSAASWLLRASQCFQLSQGILVVPKKQTRPDATGRTVSRKQRTHLIQG